MKIIDIKHKKLLLSGTTVSNSVFLAVLSLLISLLISKAFVLEHFIGVFFITAISLSILFVDIFRYKPSYLKQRKMLILLGIMFFMTMVFSRATEYVLFTFVKGFGIPELKSLTYGIPVHSGAMLVALMFDSHTAIVFAFVMSIISGIWQQDPYYTFYVFAGSIVAAFSVIRCKRRTDLLRGGLYISAVNVVTAAIVAFLSAGDDIFQSFHSLIFAATTGITISAYVSIVLPTFEYLFKITTDITLIELLDLNQPLMKNLMINAPGTYHHSVIVGNLVEAASEQIGVNPLLARVTAYYHDIGKIKMPDYFVENQSSAISKHEKLTPHMSSMILISHVKEGLELADEYKLPEPVKDIITQHHGTNIIMYFYQKAKEEQAEPPDEEDYRYPGPKPQTRVAALVMIADAVEAASRVIKEPTPARVSGLVDKIINNVLLDGQLNECDLTLKNINVIKERFTYILLGILHKRIEYPGFDFNKPTFGEGEKDKGLDKESQQKDKDRHSGDKTPPQTGAKVLEFKKG
ncbi:MAG: HDIG domain-containing protein [Nitrospirae bacterium]|nr:HDIG domain-containing protein [Nitrospirota bacterium]MBF0534957.1 HDIG domain-containing protein [Nitrospirota bacterium]MBF0617192.1 HDIG domain-containing protein [Nitrospirota bacterium]